MSTMRIPLSNYEASRIYQSCLNNGRAFKLDPNKIPNLAHFSEDFFDTFDEAVSIYTKQYHELIFTQIIQIDSPALLDLIGSNIAGTEQNNKLQAECNRLHKRLNETKNAYKHDRDHMYKLLQKAQREYEKSLVGLHDSLLMKNEELEARLSQAVEKPHSYEPGSNINVGKKSMTIIHSWEDPYDEEVQKTYYDMFK